MTHKVYKVDDFGPSDLLTSDKPGFRRVQVDVGQTGFFEGRDFRLIRKLNFNTTIIYKFSSPVDFILFEQGFSCSVGDFEFFAWRSGDVTETAPFNTELPIFGKNISSEYRSFNGGPYQAQATVSTGGTLSIPDRSRYVDYARLATSNATAQRVTVGGPANSQRYLAAGDYYLEFVPAAASEGAFQIAWEERPGEVQA